MRIKDCENRKMRKEEYEHDGNVLIQFLVRIIYLAVVILIMTVLIFGIYRIPDDSMSPGMKAGDLVLVYRLDKNYLQNDLTVTKQENEFQLRRVLAVEGDTVEISEEGLVINGNLQNEINIYEDTLAYEEGVHYPIRMKNKEIFLLADARENANDSRYYGPVNISDTKGMVIAVLRHNGL